MKKIEKVMLLKLQVFKNKPKCYNLPLSTFNTDENRLQSRCRRSRDTRKLFILKFEHSLYFNQNFEFFVCLWSGIQRLANKNETKSGQEERVKVMTNLLRLFEFIHDVVFFSCRNVIKLMSTP